MYTVFELRWQKTPTRRSQHSQECKHPHQQLFVTRDLWTFHPSKWVSWTLVKFGDPSCISFWDIMRKSRQTDRQTHGQTDVNALPIAWHQPVCAVYTGYWSHNRSRTRQQSSPTSVFTTWRQLIWLHAARRHLMLVVVTCDQPTLVSSSSHARGWTTEIVASLFIVLMCRTVDLRSADISLDTFSNRLKAFLFSGHWHVA